MGQIANVEYIVEAINNKKPGSLIMPTNYKQIANVEFLLKTIDKVNNETIFSGNINKQIVDTVAVDDALGKLLLNTGKSAIVIKASNPEILEVLFEPTFKYKSERLRINKTGTFYTPKIIRYFDEKYWIVYDDNKIAYSTTEFKENEERNWTHFCTLPGSIRAFATQSSAKKALIVSRNGSANNTYIIDKDLPNDYQQKSNLPITTDIVNFATYIGGNRWTVTTSGTTTTGAAQSTDDGGSWSTVSMVNYGSGIYMNNRSSPQFIRTPYNSGTGTAQNMHICETGGSWRNIVYSRFNNILPYLIGRTKNHIIVATMSGTNRNFMQIGIDEDLTQTNAPWQQSSPISTSANWIIQASDTKFISIGKNTSKIMIGETVYPTLPTINDVGTSGDWLSLTMAG
jgi:hypothetical protein